ncbi:hypothetical protein REC_133 [Pseudomonas phage REC]|nr:hypothetical protein REC_133 [Pseudomonas phage REC]
MTLKGTVCMMCPLHHTKGQHMNIFWLIFWVCVVLDVVVPGVDIALGWYILWAFLGTISE